MVEIFPHHDLLEETLHVTISTLIYTVGRNRIVTYTSDLINIV